MSRTFFCAFCSVALAWFCTQVAAWSNQGSLASCLETAVRDARERGAKIAQRLPATFLIAPNAAHSDFIAPETGCLGFLAVGRRHVQALRLTIFDRTDRVLALSPGRGAYAYVRACVEAGTHVIAYLQVREGGGEVAMMVLLSAPERLLGLTEVMAHCRPIGLPRHPLVDVGPEPVGWSLPQRLAHLTEQLAGSGYRPTGAPLSGALGALDREIRRIWLPGGGCVALSVMIDNDEDELEVRAFSPEPSPKLLDRDRALGRPTLVKLCAQVAGLHLLDIRSYGHGGSYLAQAFELQRPAAVVAPIGLTEVARIALWETSWRLSNVGLAIGEAYWVHLPAPGDYRAPLALQGERCYGIGALGSAEGTQPDVALSLTDSKGNVIVQDSGAGRWPLVFHCPQHAGTYGLHAHVSDPGRPVRALLLVASDWERPQAP